MEPQLSYYYEFVESGSVYEVYDLKKLPAILNVEDAVQQVNMTDLNNYLLGNSLDADKNEESQEDVLLQRLSLAYENLHSIPRIIVDELADNIKILDISNNRIDDLYFLREMKSLSSLICDHNDITSKTEIPYMPMLELLWMNNCKISELFPWCRKLRNACPNLKFLSLMGNPAVPSYFRGSNFYDYIQYRLFLISLFPRLVHLDEKKVLPEERQEAEKIYQKPIIDRLIPGANVYLRKTTDRLTELFSTSQKELRNDISNQIV